MIVHACRMPEPAWKKVPRHFVRFKSVVNVAAVFFVIGHCQRILFFPRPNYGTRDRREGGTASRGGRPR